LNVTLPKTVALKVVQTDPGMKTAAVNNTLKPATLETGMVINVPHFVAADEIATRISGAREITRRVVPDRAGMTIFFAPAAEKLGVLRTAEDLFGLAGYRAGVGPESAALDKIRAAAREAPLVEAALQARVKVSPGTRAGRRLRFRVIARMAGEHEFRRVDFQRAVERGILERGDHTWRLEEEDADVEFWATMIDAEF